MKSIRRHIQLTGTLWSLLLLGSAAAAPGASGPARLVKDINPTLSPMMGSLPGGFLTLGNITLFRAFTPEAGVELWRTDGTEAGTVFVKDLLPGPASGLSSSPGEGLLATVGDTFFLLANDLVHGNELWRTDGTEAGTFMLRDIRPGGLHTFTSDVAHAEAGGLFYFLANDADYGNELWRSDGSAAGTFLLGDIRPGREGAFGDRFPPFIAGANGVMYFSANDGMHGTELWRTAGTVAGTALVADVKPGPEGSFPDSFIEYDGTLLFSASAAGVDVELWASDGPAAGTRLIADLFPGPLGSKPLQLTEAGGVVSGPARTSQRSRTSGKPTAPPGHPPAQAVPGRQFGSVRSLQR